MEVGTRNNCNRSSLSRSNSSSFLGLLSASQPAFHGGLLQDGLVRYFQVDFSFYDLLRCLAINCCGISTCLHERTRFKGTWFTSCSSRDSAFIFIIINNTLAMWGLPWFHCILLSLNPLARPDYSVLF